MKFGKERGALKNIIKTLKHFCHEEKILSEAKIFLTTRRILLDHGGNEVYFLLSLSFLIKFDRREDFEENGDEKKNPAVV